MLATLFFAGFALLPPLIMVRRVFLDRRMRFLVFCLCSLAAAISIVVFMDPHYLAPFTVAFYALGLQAMRHLRLWAPNRSPIGKTMVRLSITVCVLMVPMELLARPVHFRAILHPNQQQLASAGGPVQSGSERAEIESRLCKPSREATCFRTLPSKPQSNRRMDLQRADINSCQGDMGMGHGTSQ